MTTRGKIAMALMLAGPFIAVVSPYLEKHRDSPASFNRPDYPQMPKIEEFRPKAKAPSEKIMYFASSFSQGAYSKEGEKINHIEDAFYPTL